MARDWWDEFKDGAVQYTPSGSWDSWESAFKDVLMEGIQGRLEQIRTHIVSQLNTYRYKAEGISDAQLSSMMVSEVEQLKYDVNLLKPAINSITQKSGGQYIYSDSQLRNIAQSLLQDESRVNTFYVEHRNMFDRIPVFHVNAKNAVSSAMRDLTPEQRDIIEGKGGNVNEWERALVRNMFYGKLLEEYAKELPPGVTVGLEKRLAIDREYIETMKPTAVQQAAMNAVDSAVDTAKQIADRGKKAAEDAMSFFDRYKARIEDLFRKIIRWGIMGAAGIVLGGGFLLYSGIKSIRRK